MSVLAHIAGVPVEELLLSSAPVAGLVLTAVAARVATARDWRRRRT